MDEWWVLKKLVYELMAHTQLDCGMVINCNCDSPGASDEQVADGAQKLVLSCTVEIQSKYMIVKFCLTLVLCNL